VCGKEEVPRVGFEDCHEPVGDMQAPQHEQIDTVIRFINDLSARQSCRCIVLRWTRQNREGINVLPCESRTFCGRSDCGNEQ